MEREIVHTITLTEPIVLKNTGKGEDRVIEKLEFEKVRFKVLRTLKYDTHQEAIGILTERLTAQPRVVIDQLCFEDYKKVEEYVLPFLPGLNAILKNLVQSLGSPSETPDS
ncbi:MAG: phage tail assembly protein [Bdellovibrionota bacterium]